MPPLHDVCAHNIRRAPVLPVTAVTAEASETRQQNMWGVLGNASLDESGKVPRQQQQQRKKQAATPSGTTSAASQHAKPTGKKLGVPIQTAVSKAICGKYRIIGTMRKGATGYLYSAVTSLQAEDEDKKSAAGIGSAGGGVVLKVEECAAPKRQMQTEWAVSFSRGEPINSRRLLVCS